MNRLTEEKLRKLIRIILLEAEEKSEELITEPDDDEVEEQKMEVNTLGSAGISGHMANAFDYDPEKKKKKKTVKRNK
jgi:hypothetical protein